MMKFSSLISVILLAVIAFVAIGCNGSGDYTEVTAQKSTVHQVFIANAISEPQVRLSIRAPLAGQVLKLNVKEGDTVTPGQVVGTFSSTERSILLNSALNEGAGEVEYWKELFRPIPLVSDFKGKVIRVHASEGQFANGQSVLIDVADRIVMKCEVDETDLPLLKQGLNAMTILEAEPSRPISGKIAEVAYDASGTRSGNAFEVLVEPNDAKDLERSGLTATIYVILDSRPDVLAVPLGSVQSKDGKDYVITPGWFGTSQKEVELGFRDGFHAEVISGLSEGETVLVPRLVFETSTSLSPFLTPQSKLQGVKQP